MHTKIHVFKMSKLQELVTTSKNNAEDIIGRDRIQNLRAAAAIKTVF